MPYKSRAELERECWMMLPEAVAHIRDADGCDEAAARQQIIKALADGVRALGLLRWEKEKGDKPPFGSTGITVPSDTPPSGRDWLTAKIRWNAGRVRNDWSEYKSGKWRVLLILRAKVEQLWPKTSQLGDSAMAAQPKRGRPPEYNWPQVKIKLGEYTSQNGAVRSMDELIQKCSDFARDLHPQKKTPDDATIRAAISDSKYRLDIAAGFAPGNSPGK
jgi:hypothetical protein